jgi:putative DNA primase/helicase
MPENSENILINLKNGTFEIDRNGKGELRPANKSDFLKYQLPFKYDSGAQCPLFQKYLDISLPDKASQAVLAEYIGYVFAPNLKLEKALILYGSGANGKSVFFDIISALLGTQNVSSYSIDALCEQNGYYRAMIANKLINYSSEIGKRFEVDKFKQLCSGEPVEARLPYGEPFQIRNYARLVFNANQLPKDTEQTTAFFRRFLIIPFTVTIPPGQQDIELSKKIIDNELSGVFNWVLSGLDRIIKQKGFSKCDAAEKELEQYRRESDSVEMFIDENDYRKSINDSKQLKDLYSEYRIYCNDVGNRTCSLKTFSQRLKDKGFEVMRNNAGRIIYIEQSNNESPY